VRVRTAATATIVLAVTLGACTRGPITPTLVADPLQIRPVEVPRSPSPLMEVKVGSVRGLFPKGWDARIIPDSDLAQEGFEASPHIDDWDRGVTSVQGMEAFWIDVGKVGIPSDYYYLAARSVSFGSMASGTHCALPRQNVVANHPPDLTGRHDSPSDFVASVHGTCVGADGTPTRWGYIVAAPGFGPIRSVGIPNSGLYVVMAEVSGPHAAALLREMLSGASFGNTTVTQLVQAAGREQPN
jgi:hypothetical protein